MITVTLRRNGDLLCFDVPEEVTAAVKWREGDELHVSVVGGRIVLTPCDSKFRETMEAAEEAFQRYGNAYAELSKK